MEKFSVKKSVQAEWVEGEQRGIKHKRSSVTEKAFFGENVRFIVKAEKWIMIAVTHTNIQHVKNDEGEFLSGQRLWWHDNWLEQTFYRSFIRARLSFF